MVFVGCCSIFVCEEIQHKYQKIFYLMAHPKSSNSYKKLKKMVTLTKESFVKINCPSWKILTEINNHQRNFTDLNFTKKLPTSIFYHYYLSQSILTNFVATTNHHSISFLFLLYTLVLKVFESYIKLIKSSLDPKRQQRR